MLRLTHILSEDDHRLNHVALWAKQSLQTLRECSGQPVHPLDVGDDRLATVLEALSDDTRWSTCEKALNQHALRVYDLQLACVRLDSTTAANGHWSVTDDGLFQLGHSKDHRPDVPQVKIMVSALAPLGMRAYLHAGGDYYVCPWSERHLPPAVLADYLAPVWAEERTLTVMHRAPPGGLSQLIAEGFERLAPVTAEVAGQRYRGQERRLVLRPYPLAQAAGGLHGRLAKAQAEITALNRHGWGRQRCADPRA